MGPRIADDDDQAQARPRSISEHASAAVSRKVDAILAPWKRAAGYLLALVLGGGAGSAATGLAGSTGSTGLPASDSQVAEVVPPEQLDRKCASNRDVRLALDWLREIAEGLRAAGIAIEEPPPNTIPAALHGKPQESSETK